jgi:hypothetical protein
MADAPKHVVGLTRFGPGISATPRRARATLSFRGYMNQTNAMQSIFHQCDWPSIFPWARRRFDLDQTAGQARKNAVNSFNFQSNKGTWNGVKYRDRDKS